MSGPNRGEWGRSGGLARSHASPYGVARARARARPVVINYFNLLLLLVAEQLLNKESIIIILYKALK